METQHNLTFQTTDNTISVTVTTPGSTTTTTITPVTGEPGLMNLEVTQTIDDNIPFTPDLFCWHPTSLTGNQHTEQQIRLEVKALLEANELTLPDRTDSCTHHWLMHTTYRPVHDDEALNHFLGENRTTATSILNPALEKAGFTFPEIGIGNQEVVLLNLKAPYGFVQTLYPYLPESPNLSHLGYLYVKTSDAFSSLQKMETAITTKLKRLHSKDFSVWAYRLYCSLPPHLRDHPRTWEMITLGVYSPTRIHVLMQQPELTDREVQQFNSLPEETFHKVFNF